MSAPRVTRGGTAAADAAREQRQRREQRDAQAREAMRRALGEVELAVDSDDDVDELLMRGGDNVLGKAKQHVHRCNDVMEAMDLAIDTLVKSIKAHLVRQDEAHARALRAQLREVLVAKRRLAAQQEALTALAARGAVGGPLPAGANAAQQTSLLVPSSRPGNAPVPAFKLDAKLRTTDWRARVDSRVSVNLGPGSAFNPDKDDEIVKLERFARIAKVKLYDGMKSDDEGDDDDRAARRAGGGGQGGGGQGDESDDSEVQVQAATRGAIPGVLNVVCPYTQIDVKKLNDPVVDDRGYVYERAAVEGAIRAHEQSYRARQPFPHPVAGVRGDLDRSQLRKADEVWEYLGKGEMSKFRHAVQRCEKAGATAGAILERQRQDAAHDAAAKAAAKAAGGAAGGSSAEVVNVGDSSEDEEMEEAGGKGKKAAAAGKGKKAAPASRGGRLQTKAAAKAAKAAKAAAAGKRSRTPSEEADDGLEEEDLPEVVVLDDEEDDAAAAAAEYVRLEDEDDEDEGGRSDEGGRGGTGGRRPAHAAAAAARHHIESSEEEATESDAEEDAIESGSEGGGGGGGGKRARRVDDDDDDVLDA